MRSRLLAIVSLLFILTFAGAAHTAFAYQLPCYCRYDATHADFQASSDAQRFCANEVYYWGLVNGDTRGEADAACTLDCNADGTRFVSTTSVQIGLGLPASFPNPVDMVTHEERQCVFTAFNHLQQPPTHWESAYAGCREPLNSILNQPFPEACSFCYCKFKAGAANQPAACAGKTTMVKATSYPAKCEALCSAIGLDPAGQGTDSYGGHCDYRLTNGCTQPANPRDSGCASELGALGQQQASDSFQASRGSALGQFLPLGDLSLPNVIARVIRQLLGIVGAIALIFFLWGGFKYMTAAGDDKKVVEARNMIVAAISGLAAIFLSYAILSLLINALQ